MSSASGPILSSGRATLNAEADSLRAAAQRLGDEFCQAVSLILSRQGKVVVTGLGKSGHVGRKIASTLSSTGTSSTFLHPSEALHGDFGMLQNQDILLAIAYGGETSEVVDVAKFARRIGITVIAFTGKKDSSLGQLSHVIINCQVDREADPHNLAPTNSSTLTMALGDALAVSLMEARGFTPRDFASLHPGGSLGRKLSLVKDHMHRGDRLPKINKDDDFYQVLRAVTVDNFGIAAVVDGDHLVGAISDGDLRRSLLAQGSDALKQKAYEIMSNKPLTILDSELAIEAAIIMNNKSVSRLFVESLVNNQKHLVGLVRLQDLLAAKIF